MALFPCPCCGWLVFHGPPGSYAICHICFWEDDLHGLEAPTEGGGANSGVSLVQAQANFAAIGASEPRLLLYVRQPGHDEVRDPAWRPFDPQHDLLAMPTREGAAVYYWRKTPAD